MKSRSIFQKMKEVKGLLRSVREKVGSDKSKRLRGDYEKLESTEEEVRQINRGVHPGEKVARESGENRDISAI